MKPQTMTTDMETMKAEAKIAGELSAQIRPLLAGFPPGVTGAVLVDLVAVYISGWQPDARAHVLAGMVDVVKTMTEDAPWPPEGAELWPQTETTQ